MTAIEEISMIPDWFGNDFYSDEANKNNSRQSLKRKTVFNKSEKWQKIEKTLDQDPVDVSSLKQFAISPGGLLDDELRKEIWPILLDVDIDNIPPKPGIEILHGHRDYNQVLLDVNRSLKRFPPGMDENIRLGLQDQLVDLIMRVLVNHEELHYYQGYHDICVTFLLVVGEDVAFALVDKLSLNHLRDFMDANMDRTKHILNYLYPIVGKSNPELREFMERSEVGTVFSLSWLITWYGHVLNDLRQIVRFYDFFIACHPLMPIYLAAAIVLHRADEILASECDMCIVHGLLSKIPQDLPFEQLISKAGDLYLQYPPSDLAYDAILNFQMTQSYTKARSRNRQKFTRKKKTDKKRWFVFNQDGKSGFLKFTFWTVTTAVVSAAVIAYLRSWEWG
ncbi:hypothetical protein CHS0354_009393 [Potamilus streckersoni]|uniref:TBC1 domain family member 20 n=1 Tax=Potamilus streckersoni TaxID=2493646 RepID=A0AAE0T460_9BIVA|nr:hypothetical protein CHS0354_009393 [Potamilus streckersoni]